MTKKEPSELTVYFNSACPVCNSGITAQKGKSTQCPIDWQDIHQQPDFVKELNTSLPKVRKYLHLMTKDGEIKIGIDAFIELWNQSPTEKWIARLISLPIIKQLADLSYFLFANALYKWNKIKKHW